MKAAGNQLIDAYITAKEEVLRRGFGEEIAWQESQDFLAVGETDFLREAAWVILNAGMREAVVRDRFPALSTAFANWTSANAIVANEARCRRAALRLFAHEGKIDAILSLSRKVSKEGFDQIKSRIALEGAEYLASFDFIGPVTCYHLAKNLGLDVVKPDRHLVRVARRTGFRTPSDLCRAISVRTGDRLAVVDIVIWRYATLTRDDGVFRAVSGP